MKKTLKKHVDIYMSVSKNEVYVCIMCNVYVNMSMSMSMSMYMCMYVRMYVCMYMYIYICYNYIHPYIRTHIHIYPPFMAVSVGKLLIQQQI